MATKRGQKSGLDEAASNGKASAPSPANAWARPLKTTGPPPGMGPADKARAPSSNSGAGGKKTAGGKANEASEDGMACINRERLLHVSLTLVGKKVEVTLTDGTVLEGVFHTFTPFDGLPADKKNKYVLNAVKVVKEGSENSIKDGGTGVIGVEKVVYVHAKHVDLDRSKNGGGFTPAAKGGKNDVMTDTQISGSRGGRGRDLVAAGTAWTNTPGGKQSRAEALAGALEDTKGTRKGFGTALKGDNAGLQGSIGQWDQFKANQELFNVNASFDENLYTTQLDKSQMDSQKVAEAERIAREIENTSSSNIHVAEERGHIVETDYDEEDRYSGVLTKDGKQRHEAKVEKGKASAPTAVPKKMNYAAAAAKADTGKKVVPPGFGGAEKPADSSEAKELESTPKTETNKKSEVVAEKVAEVKKPKKDAAKEGTKADSSKMDEKKTEEPKKEKEATKGGKIEEKKLTKKENKSADKESKKDDEKTEEKKDTKKVAKTSKLNANAKAFTFNPSAKSFTPSFGGGTSASTGSNFSAPQNQQPQHMADPNMQMHSNAHPMQPPHYMHASPMGQPGMMPMMNPQYPGMRYPPQFGGMDQHGVPQMQQHQPQHVQQATSTPTQSQPPSTPAPTASTQGGTTPSTGEKETPGGEAQEGESSQPSVSSQQKPQQPQQQPQQQQQPIPMPYNVPPQGAYFASGGIPMHPRGPGYPHQFVGGPQQMPVGPGGAPYRQMYPMQPGGMPPNMHMRPGGAPYYPGPNAPMQYPQGPYGHGMMDEDGGFRGRGRGQGRGRGRRGGRGGRGPGRGHYQHHQYSGHSSGRSTPQQQTQGDGNSQVTTEAAAQDGEKSKDATSAEVSS